MDDYAEREQKTRRDTKTGFAVAYVAHILIWVGIAHLVADNFYAVLACGFIAGAIGEAMRRGISVWELRPLKTAPSE